MLFFKASKSIIKQKQNFIKEVYYKLFKLFVIFLKWNNLLGNLIIQKKRSLYYHNICIMSQKAKSISRKLKVSRIMIREKSNIGFFFGLTKLSW
jgi:ribosomal protein S14